MNIMRKHIIFFFLTSYLAMPIAGQCSDSSHDGRDNTPCNGKEYSCFINFSQLLANPKNFDNKNIAINGYLVLDDKILAFYPSEFSYELYDSTSSLTFNISATEQYAIAKKYAYNYVRITGHFSYRDEGADGMRIGVLDRVISIIPIKRRDAVGKYENPTVRADDLDDNFKKTH